jgi:hypothetical protein
MNIENNSKCFTFESHYFNKGIFDDAIDCTYIIHLLNNGRLQSIYDEIKNTIPSKTVIIAKNLGYKKCNKKLIENAPYQDLTDAFLQCFSHAKKNGFKNIIILEDDFIFNKNITQSDIDKISDFIKVNKDEEYVLNLGCLPVAIYPSIYSGMYRTIKNFGMHCNIYSEKLINNMDNLDVSAKHWDVIIEKNVKLRYMFYRPLCYQTFPETENKKTWEEKDGTPIIGYLKNGVIYGLGLDKTPEPGFTILYWFAKIIFVLFIFIIGWILFYIYTKIGLNKNSNYCIKNLKNKFL